MAAVNLLYIYVYHQCCVIRDPLHNQLGIRPQLKHIRQLSTDPRHSQCLPVPNHDTLLMSEVIAAERSFDALWFSWKSVSSDSSDITKRGYRQGCTQRAAAVTHAHTILQHRHIWSAVSGPTFMLFHTQTLKHTCSFWVSHR